MQLCDSCGACRENEWRVCPFCRAPLVVSSAQAAESGGSFDALAAVAELSDGEVLPSPIDVDEPDDEFEELITEQDLAHLTGGAGPSTKGWDSPQPATPATASDEAVDDDVVAPALVLSLAAIAVAAVVFVAHSIVTTERTVRPDAVALVDATTTTTTIATTTEPPVAEPGFGPIGVDLAEQISRVCSGEQFGVARAPAATTAIHNDLVVSQRDGQSDWSTDPDQITLRADVPAVIGCLTTVDGGEIDRCPGVPNRISRRSVSWTYRVVQTSDGTELGIDTGTATEVRDCVALVTEANGNDYASYSVLPWTRLDAVAPAYTGAPHPTVACRADDNESNGAADSTDAEPLVRPAIHASPEEFTDVDLDVPEAWRPSPERPVEVVICVAEEPSGSPLGPNDEAECIVTATARHRDGRDLGSWSLEPAPCRPDRVLDIPTSWWSETVGPDLGYPIDAEPPATSESATDDDSTDGSAAVDDSEQPQPEESGE